MPKRNRLTVAGILFLMSLVTYACFLQDPENSNVSSRMFLTLSLVGNGDVSIDRYANLTIDKSESHGRFYSDKAPGLSLLAVPVTALLWRPIISIYEHRSHTTAEQSPRGWPPAYYLFSYFATLSTSALITAVSVAAMFLVALSVFGSPVGAVLVAVAYGFATPAFGWATAFVGHAPTMGLLCIGLACAQFLGHNATTPRRDCFLVVAGVACLTWAIVTEFTAAPVAAAVAVYASRKIISADDHRAMLVSCALITGFLFLLPLLIYNHLAFGAPWRLGYQSVLGFAGMKVGFLGLGTPQLNVLYEITCGARRGILLLCPLLLLVPMGLLQMSIRDGQRGLALMIVLVVTYYLALNSSYYYWTGGYSTGPRHITAMLPFACLPLGSVWNSASREMRAFVFLLVSASLALAVGSASTGMFAGNIDHLLLDYLIPGFFGGARTVVPVQLFDWRSRYFLLSLFSLWICLALMIARQLGRSQRAAQQIETFELS